MATHGTMEFIYRVDFEPRRLDKSEYGILQILERLTREIAGGYRVMAQTSVGEIIAPNTEEEILPELRVCSMWSTDGEFFEVAAWNDESQLVC